MGTTVHLPITCNYSLFESTNETNISCLHYCVCCHVDWQLGRYNQRSTAGSKHVDLSVFVRIGVLCLPAHCFGFDNSTIESHLVGYALVRFDLALDRISLGNKGFVCICRTVCEERKETAGSVSRVFLLLDSWMAHSTILMENQVEPLTSTLHTHHIKYFEVSK
mmetsp:Transcript_30012/g.60286  ORF Transcript_30012/g.60286 Transcript_30012/m.60286 type:complete len:164 (+) Transcript_30012:368-859(+)